MCGSLGDEAKVQMAEMLQGLDDEKATEHMMTLVRTLTDPSVFLSLRAILNPSKFSDAVNLKTVRRLEHDLENFAPGLLLLVHKQVLAALLPVLNMDSATIHSCKSRDDLLNEVVRLALQKMRPVLESQLPAQVSWDKISQTGLVTVSIEELLLSDLASFRGTLEKKLLVAVWKLLAAEVTAQLKDSPFVGLDPVELETVIELVPYEDFQQAVSHPKQFLESLARKTGRAALKLLCLQSWHVLVR